MPKAKTPESLRGMRDLLLEESRTWYHVLDAARKISEQYGLVQMETPILEQTSLFVRSVGKTTDIVQKEMFSFEDQGGVKISARPEMTAGMARAYIERGWLNKPQPVKMFQIGPNFRHERPQKGRQRQFTQWDVEVIGSDHPVVDAELMMLGYGLMHDLGVPCEIQLNSIGTLASRKNYLRLLQDYYKPKRRNLCEDCRKRLVRNPLRLLDCKEPTCREMRQDAPVLIDHLDEESRHHFESVLEHLDEAEVPYTLNPYLVRGLDYYTHTVFEFFPEGEDKESQGALLAGGRYDGLIEELGGRPTPGIGFAAGIDRIILQLRKQMQLTGKSLPGREVDLYVAQLGEKPRKRAMYLFEQLRREGFSVTQQFSKAGLKPQLSQAAKLNAKFTLIFGQKELLDNTVLLRDMENGSQEVVDFKKIVHEVGKRLEKWREQHVPTKEV